MEEKGNGWERKGKGKEKENQEDRKKYLAAKQHKANLKSHIEKIHESKKPDDSGIKILGKKINANRSWI